VKILEIIGLQGGIADGSERTFDDQPMQHGTHLRWGFAPELGFPPGGFWLCRKRSDPSEEVLRPSQAALARCERLRGRQGDERRDRDERHDYSCGGEGDGPPRWGEPGNDGWECFSTPFVLPVTLPNWPARYAGAPDPNTTPHDEVVKADLNEAHRRLHGLSLDKDMPPAELEKNLRELRHTLVALVRDHPGPPSQYDHPLPASADGKSAPDFGINIIQQLLLLAINPYFARVLGLYFVDPDADGQRPYDYCVVGCWGKTPCATRVIAPGAASGSGLARGEAKIDGLAISVPGAPGSPQARLWRRTRDGAGGAFSPKTDPTAPGDVAQALDQAVAGLAPSDQPVAMLAADPVAAAFEDVCRIKISRPVAEAGVQLSGKGILDVFSNGALLASKPFQITGLSTVYVEATSAENPIDELLIRSEPQFVFGNPYFGNPPHFEKSIVCIANIGLYLLPAGAIGAQYALLKAPQPIKPLAAPARPIARFRHREAVVDPETDLLEPRSLFDIVWAAKDREIFSGHGAHDGIVPPPNQPMGFRADRTDTGEPVGAPTLLPGIIAPASQPTPKNERRVPKSPRMHRVTDAGVRDPRDEYVYRVAGFDPFGALGKWSIADPIGIERIAAAPTLLRVVHFDNTPAAGGVPSAAAWQGGTLTLDVGWSAAALISYPDVVTTRLQVDAIDNAAKVLGTLATNDIHVPARVPQKIKVTPTPNPAAPPIAFLRTTPPLLQQNADDPAGMLFLHIVLEGGERVVERFVARSAPVLEIRVSDVSRLVANPSLNIEAAYFVPGIVKRLTLAVPLEVPINQKAARGQVRARSSRENTFNATEKIIEPNSGDARPEPESVRQTFSGPQRLAPPTPPSPVPATHHEYYDPADFYGRASRDLPFEKTKPAGVSRFILLRSPSSSLFLADIKRRNGNARDHADLAHLVPAPNFDLQPWLESVGDWLSAFNARTGTAFNAADALQNPDAQRSFVEHFYGGLLDSELRALANIPANLAAFARVDAPDVPTRDTVDGKGFERVLYKLGAANESGSTSGFTDAVGPYYTRIVVPPRAPVLAKIQATDTAITIEWTLSNSPDIAAYLVYRAERRADLADLRFFGPDPTRPLPPSALAQLVYTHVQRPAMKFSGTPIDPRIRGLVNDRRIFARDFENSDRAEAVVPEKVNKIFGVYRTSEFDAGSDPLNQPRAFNYWRPQTDNSGTNLEVASRGVKGLRVGLGRGQPVVVVARSGGSTRVFGALATRRISFTDSATSADAIAIMHPPKPATTYFYAIVAVDIFGNRSAPSSIFSAQLI
jgi:hypothetical protein